MICRSCGDTGRHFKNKLCDDCRNDGVTPEEFEGKLYTKRFYSYGDVKEYGSMLKRAYITDIKPVVKQPYAVPVPTKEGGVGLGHIEVFTMKYYVAKRDEEAHAGVLSRWLEKLKDREADAEQVRQKVMMDHKAKAEEIAK